MNTKSENVKTKETRKRKIAEIMENDECLNELGNEVSSFFKAVEIISDKLMATEQLLKDKEIFIPFEYKLEELDGKDETNWYISWERETENTKNFRVFIIGKSFNQAEKTKKKAILQLKIGDRLRFGRYINSFIKAYTSFLKEKKEHTKKQLKKAK